MLDRGRWCAVVVAVAILEKFAGMSQANAVVGASRFSAAELAGSYCAAREGATCCSGREDECTAPIRGTHLCYCDYFCDEHVHNDCCPDFERTCKNQLEQGSCFHDGQTYLPGSTMKRNCNHCRCAQDGSWDCDDNACIVEQWLVDSINRGSDTFGWRAASYSSMRGMSLSEGVRQLLGTRPPAQKVTEMLPIRLSLTNLPDAYDARSRHAHIQPPRDQGLCASDWAVAVADVVADRLSIDTNGSFKDAISVQDILSCGGASYGPADGCHGGRVEQAFWILKEAGALPEHCYPYESGKTSKPGKCQHPGTTTHCLRIKATPAYRISTNEIEIRKEIWMYGPVLAIMEVRPDFFLYREGIYRSTGIAEAEISHAHHEKGLHAVRIIGWGIEDNINYWLAVNSWGHHWGEKGLFRIARGTNESGIESFVTATWSTARTERQSDTRRRRRKRV